jgi:hypothetical protein
MTTEPQGKPQTNHDAKELCAGWVVPACEKLSGIGMRMPTIHSLALTQDGSTIEISSQQLRVLVDKPYWLDELFRADLQKSLRAFRCGCSTGVPPTLR